MRFIPDVDFFVRYVELPYSIHGATTPNPDGTFSIYINSLLSPEMQASAYQHEVDHIVNGDFYSERSIAEIEGL